MTFPSLHGANPPTRLKKGYFCRDLLPISIVWRQAPMTEKIVQFKPPLQAIQLVVAAATAEIYGDYLVLLDLQGKLAALFLLETIQSWNEIQAQKGPEIARGD